MRDESGMASGYNQQPTTSIFTFGFIFYPRREESKQKQKVSLFQYNTITTTTMEELPIEINMEAMTSNSLFDVNYFLADIGGLQQQQQQQLDNTSTFMVDHHNGCGIAQVDSQLQLEQFYLQQQMMDMTNNNNNNNAIGCIATSATPLSSHSSPIDYASASSPTISYPSSPSMVVPNGHSSPYDSSMSSSPEHHGTNNNNNNIDVNMMMNGFISTNTDNNNNNNTIVMDDNTAAAIQLLQQQEQEQQQQHTSISFAMNNDGLNNNNNNNNVPIYEESSIDDKLKSIFDRKGSVAPSLSTTTPTTNTITSIPAPIYYQAYDDDSSSGSEGDGRKKNNKRPNDQTRFQNLVHPLTRDELFKISGKEAIQIEAQSTSTPEEERLVKKQRRLIKNRESAQLSRMRKKIFIEDLEKKISDLTTENVSLRDEVLYLQGIIKQFAHASPNLLTEVQQQQQAQQQQQQHQQHQYQLRHKNVKAAGVCLLIIIFSIGIFLNPQPSQPSFSLTSPTSSIPRTTRDISALEQPHLLDSSATSSSAIVPQDDTSLYMLSPGPFTPSSSSLPSSPRQHHAIGANDELKSLVLTKKRPAEHSSPSSSSTTGGVGSGSDTAASVPHHKKRIRILSNQDGDDDDLVEVDNSSLVYSHDPLYNHRVVAELASPSSVNGFFETPQQHSSYIVCSDAPRIISQNITQTTESIFNSNSSSPLSIGLLLPAESLGLNVSDDRTILEISCLVSNIRVWNPAAATAAVVNSISEPDSVDIHHHQQPQQQLIIHSP
ncbi:putative basic-leucine zipper transcription factor [Cavenderia fasciculata]|uniref:Basic-leucine zipper transcription factor n=1 Tax=Cavenderia fasciculata TaxID=261658 RepID=F4Q5Q6_CACFS|nr:putative basic-leucine zipper transcription factor [Cavenderia fasciculata]EGG17315.1 putative basic-leucine zipper transcription factor [Cavenderia fasciculata]|eukprot:XP_004355799.1 putative basic-leucine zipper transcription factor [Cavenderia fasciculata]